MLSKAGYPLGQSQSLSGKKTLFLLILFLTVSTVYSQHKPLKSLSSAKDDSYTSHQPGNISNIYSPTIINPYAPEGTVPFSVNYCDYVTNGNNMRRLIILGDTIIVAADINSDRTGPPPVSTVNRIYYQVSYDGGTSWQSTPINTDTITNRWPNIVPIFSSGLRSILLTGRQNTALPRGLTMVETLLGLGSFTSYLTPITYAGDFFGSYKNNIMAGGLITSPPNSFAHTDVLWYMDFNYTTGIYGTARYIADSIDVNFRYGCDIASNGQNIVAARWKSSNLWHPQAYYIHESTNGGNTWSAGTMVGNAKPVNGDSCVAWSSFDVIYKPGTTQKCLAFATLSPSNTATREGSKILFWSPNINGGNPVVVCDYRKYYFMNDTVLWNHNRNNIQVGLTPLSHPSLAYSDNGTRLYCAFSAIQKDTSSYTSGKNYHYNDILICTSVNDGATWSNPYYIAYAQRRDETYPTLAKNGNIGNYVSFVYSESGSPGSYTFFDNAPPDTVYTIYKKVYVMTDVQNYTNKIPEHYTLYQNYPNPFNPTTKIKFDIAGHTVGQTFLSVYDITGREIQTLVNEQLHPGTYEVTFDGSNLSSGIYFYRFQAGEFFDTKKLVLLK